MNSMSCCSIWQVNYVQYAVVQLEMLCPFDGACCRPMSGKSCPPVGRCPQPASFTPLCGVRSLTGCISMEGTLGGARATLDGALSAMPEVSDSGAF